MRWKGIIALLILAALAVAAALIFTDEWLEKQMEKYGSRMVGARVEFDGVDLSILQLHLSWQALQIADPENTWKNVMETGFCEFQLAFKPLLRKKILIETMQVADFQYDTDRETDGKLPEEWKPKKKKDKTDKDESTDEGGFETPQFIKNIEADMRNEVQQMPVMDLKNFTQDINTDSLLAMAQLQTPAKADSLKQLYQTRYDEWRQRIDNLPDKQEFQALETKVRGLKIDQIESVQDAQKALETIEEVLAQAKGYKKQFNELQTAFKRDKNAAQNLTKDLPRWIRDDKARILNMAKLPELSVENMGKMVFGARVMNQVEAVTGYVNKGRYYLAKLKSSEEKPAEPERRKGIDIHFAPVKKENYPSFWVKNIDFSGITKQAMQFSGVLKNVVSDQKIINQPTALHLQGTRKDQASLTVDAVFDYRKEQSEEKLVIRLDQLPLRGLRLSDTPLLPSEIESGTGTVGAKVLLQRPAFTSDIIFKAKDLRFAASAKNAQMDPRLARISEQLAASINAIDFNAKLWKKSEQDDLHFSLHSNLDEQIARASKQVFQQELERAKQQLMAKADAELQKYRQQLEAEIAKKEQELQKLVSQAENQVNQQFKAFEKQIDDEKKKLEKKAGDEIINSLENLFNW